MKNALQLCFIKLNYHNFLSISIKEIKNELY